MDSSSIIQTKLLPLKKRMELTGEGKIDSLDIQSRALATRQRLHEGSISELNVAQSEILFFKQALPKQLVTVLVFL